MLEYLILTVNCLSNSRPPGPPSFKKDVSEMQQLAAGHLGHRIELFCPFHRGCPRAQVTWIKDGLSLLERGRESGLSTVKMTRNGDLVIEVRDEMNNQNK